MIAKNGINWEEMNLYVYGKCPEYKRMKQINNNFENISHTKPYFLWTRLNNINKGHRETKGIICEEWKNYNNFLQWYEKNLYEIGDEELAYSFIFYDFDNKYISPDTSALLPFSVNRCFRDIKRGIDKGLMANVQITDENYYAIVMSGKRIVISDNLDETMEIRLNILKRQFTEFMDKYTLPEKICNRLINFSIKDIKHE